MSPGRRKVAVGESPGGATVPDPGSRASSERRIRGAAAAVGATLLVIGIRRRSLGGAVAALAGGWLLYRGYAGAVPFARSVGTGGEGGDSDGVRTREAASDRPETERSVTVGRPADELYELWRDPETATRVLGGTVEVTAPSDDRRRWTVSGPLGRSVTWETRITEDRSGESLRWESVEGATVSGEGSVQFRPAPADRGTEVTLRLRFDPPGGAVGAAVTERLGVVPGTLAERALDRFKSLAETGEIPTLARNPSARGRGDAI